MKRMRIKKINMEDFQKVLILEHGMKELKKFSNELIIENNDLKEKVKLLENKLDHFSKSSASISLDERVKLLKENNKKLKAENNRLMGNIKKMVNEISIRNEKL